MDIKKEISPYNHYNGGNHVSYIVVHSTGNVGDTAKNNADYFYRANRGASAHYFVDDREIWQVVEEYNGAWHVGDGRGRYGITNSNSIGIEMCGTGTRGCISQATIDRTIELIKYLMKRYNVPMSNVVRHYDASRKNCPAQFSSNNWARWLAFKHQLGGQATPSKVTVNSPTQPSASKPIWQNYIHGDIVTQLQRELNKQGFGPVGVDGYVGNVTLGHVPLVKPGAQGNITKIIQKLLNMNGPKYSCGCDGIYGSRTKSAVIAFQKAVGLSADGLCGKNTWEALLRL